MIARLSFGKGHVVCDRINCNVPNEYSGIGDIIVHAAEHSLWTGEVHLMGDEFTFHFGKIVKIETCCDNQPWTLLWKKSEPFTYADYYLAADLLRKALQ